MPIPFEATKSAARPRTLKELRASGWQSKTVKQEIHDNFLRHARCRRRAVSRHRRLRQHRHPRNQPRAARRARHAVPRRKGAGQEPADAARWSASSTRKFPTSISPKLRCTTIRSSPITTVCRRFVAEHPEEEVPIAWWPREDRYAERLAPGTKFADIIGEIDPAKLAGGTSMSAEEALHFGLIPRMHRGIFAMNELPELDELVQVGLFNILEERDVQIRGYPDPVRYRRADSVLRQPGHVQPQRQGHSAAEGPHRLGHPHALSARSATWASQIMEQEAALNLDGDFPVVVPYFMKQIIEEITVAARRSQIHRSQFRRQRPLQHRQLSHDGRQRPAARRPSGRKAGRAADQRPGPPLCLVAGQARARHDGQPSDDRAASARRHHGRGDQQSVRGIRRSSTAWTRSPRSSPKA